jgi:protein-tyrosine phosphatase
VHSLIKRCFVIFTNILVVCMGNICRSPSAERVFRRHLPGNNISSAGIGALVNEPIHPGAAVLLRKHGYDTDNHSARQIDGVMLNDADLVLVMDKGHQATLMKRYPSSSGKVMLLGAWLDKEIHDPYRKSDEVFKYVFEQIEESCLSWCSKIGG